MELNGATVAITGAGRGIGLATAEAFARRGGKVAIGDVDLDAAMLAAARVPGSVALPVDVTDRESFATFLDGAEAEFGPLAVIVNNAGVQHVGRFVEEDQAATARQIDVNIWGVIYGTQLALERMLPRGRGRIVNLASAAGKTGTPGGATYAATKHAVIGLSESVRGEIRGSGVEVTVVCPAIIGTEMADGISNARGVKTIAPADAGEAIVAAVERGREEVSIPAWSAAVARLIAVLPRAGSDAIRRAMRIDEVLTEIDPAAREGYEGRVAAANPGSDPDEVAASDD